MSQVQTTKGFIDIELLEVRDIVTNEENARVIATEWYLDGEMVRRDVTVSVLRGFDLTSAQEAI